MLQEMFGKKLGMTQVFDSEGNLVGVTVVELEPVCILEKKDYPKGIRARVGCFKEAKPENMKKPLAGYFKKLELPPYQLVREVSVTKDTELTKGSEVGIDIFKEGEVVDVRARTKGKGFQGGVRRYGWHGGPKSHGSMSHRRIGSAGSNTDPGRVLRGHRMPGHMGCALRTTTNVKIIKVDREKKLLFIGGSIPGARGNIVTIKKQGV